MKTLRTQSVRTDTLNIAGMIAELDPMKFIFNGRVLEGKYDDVRTCIPNTSNAGLRGKQVGDDDSSSDL